MNVTVSLIKGANIGIEYLDQEIVEQLEIKWGVMLDALFFRFLITG